MPVGIYKRIKPVWNKGMVIDRAKYPMMGHFQKHSNDTRQKMRKTHKSMSDEGREKHRQIMLEPKRREQSRIIAKKLALIFTSEQIAERIKKISGSNNYNWKGGFKNRGKHTVHDPYYRKWRTEVFKRDQFKCRIKNYDCKGQLEAHHILNWVDYPELRFEINNGITLCHTHHPRGRVKEKQLEPVLKALVLASKV